MPNLRGVYTLAEVTKRLDLTTSWINKIRAALNLGGGLGISGKKSEFNEEDITVLHGVKILRLLDYSLEDIKHIHDLEKKIISMSQDRSADIYTYPLHGIKSVSRSPKSENSADEYKKLHKELTDIVVEISRRGMLLKDELGTYINRLGLGGKA